MFDGRSTETGQRSRCPAGCSRWWARSDWEGPAADGRQFHGRLQQTIGSSRAAGMPTRQSSDTNQLSSLPPAFAAYTV